MWKLGLAALALITGVMIACEKDDDGSGSGSMSVRMTDEPGAFIEVNVDIQSVQALYAGEDSTDESSWITLDTDSGVYNLLDFQGDTSTIIATEGDLPEGEIKEIRLVLGTENNVMLEDSTQFDLQTPSGQSSGLKLKIDNTIRADQNMEVFIDFDANKSIVVKGSGEYLLKPVITLKSVTHE